MAMAEWNDLDESERGGPNLAQGEPDERRRNEAAQRKRQKFHTGQ